MKDPSVEDQKGAPRTGGIVMLVASGVGLAQGFAGFVDGRLTLGALGLGGGLLLLGVGVYWLRAGKNPSTIASSEPAVVHSMDPALAQQESESLAGQVADLRAEMDGLRGREARLNAIMTTAVDAIIIIDELGRIEAFNQGAVQMFGYQPEEVIGENVSLLMDQPHRDAHDGYIARYLYAGDKRIVGKTRDVEGRCKDGTHIPISLALSEVDVSFEDRRIFAGILRDVSQAQAAAQALETAKERAEAASADKSRFVADVSHEIRTPMNGILGMAELALKTPLNSEQQEYLELIRSSGQGLLGLINDLLDFSQNEVGKRPLEKIRFSLRHTLDIGLKPLEFKAREKGIDLEFHCAPAVPQELLGDPDRLRQVLVNLVGNAVKFTDQGGVSVTVEIEDLGADAVVLRFAVRDSGIGIPQEKQEAIFDAFTQADSATRRLYGGTGLGLAISQQLILGMGGRIWLESTQGHGTVFYFTAMLGLIKESNTPGLPTSETLPLMRRSGRILVAEDDPVSRLLLIRLLEKQGYDLLIATNGQEAWEALQVEEGLALAILDVKMPQMDGEEVVQALRNKEAETGAHLPVIALTALALAGDREALEAAGVDAYLTKPVQPNTLYQMVDKLLQKDQATDV